MSCPQYLEAKKNLHASIPEKLVCRNKELEDVENQIETCFKEKKPISLYINGPPGFLESIFKTLKVD